MRNEGGWKGGDIREAERDRWMEREGGRKDELQDELMKGSIREGGATFLKY